MPVPGFPVRVDGPVYASPLLADIDGDDTLEVIVAADDKKLHAWRHDGTPVPGFPVALGMETRSTPAASNLDGVPGKEIVVLSGDSRVFAVRKDGTVLPGFPALQAWVDWVTSSVALSDVDGDGKTDIVVNNKKGLYLLDHEGRVKPGWPVFFDRPSVASPAVGNIDDDPYSEIVVANGNKLYAFNYNGTLVTGFPVVVSEKRSVQSSPIIVDVDGRIGGEIIIGSPDGRLCAYDGRGNPVAGFPLTLGGGTHSTPMAFEFNGRSATMELAAAADDGRLYIWSLPAQPQWTAGWCRFHAVPDNSGFLPNSGQGFPQSRDMAWNLYLYPNPVKKAQGRIRFSAGDVSWGNCKVFNLAGDLVQSLDFTAQPRTDNEIKWDTSNLASGVYIIRVEVSGMGGTKVLTCKAAVIK